MKFALKLGLALALPYLAYRTGVSLPVLDKTWRTHWNNFLWMALFIYYVVYLPLWGLKISPRNWVFKFLAVFVGIAVVVTTFTYTRDERTRSLQPPQQSAPASP